MRSGQTLAALAVLAITASGAGRALAQPPVPDDLARAVLDWGVCRGHVVDEHFRGPETAVAIIEDSVKECGAEEAKVRDLAAQHYGSEGAGLIDQLAAAARPGLMAMVDQRRSGSGFSDPSIAWGDCMGKRVLAAIPGREAPEAVVDQAFAACNDIEQKIPGAAGSARDQAHALMRARSLEMIADGRKGR